MTDSATSTATSSATPVVASTRDEMRAARAALTGGDVAVVMTMGALHEGHAELIREAALEGVRDELPHSVAVVVEEMALREGRPDDRPLMDVWANLFVERDSHKGIIIGKGGSRLREIGARARAGIERMLGTKVHLDLRVKVAKEWQRDPKQLGRLGF